MIKRIISIALTAMLLYLTLNCGIISLDRISSTRVRAEIMGAAVVLELDRIYETAAKYACLLSVWFDALPQTFAVQFENAGELAADITGQCFPDNYRPSCSLC